MARREIGPSERFVTLGLVVVMGLAYAAGCRKKPTAEPATPTAEEPGAAPEARPTPRVSAVPTPTAPSVTTAEGPIAVPEARPTSRVSAVPTATAPSDTTGSVRGGKKGAKKKSAKKVSAEEGAPTGASPAPSSGIGAELTELRNSLPPGQIAYAPQREMRQGVESSVTARVGRGQVPGLQAGVPAEEGKVEVQPIQVSMKMTARLEYDETEFKVIPKEPSEKVLVDMVEWRWRVTPLKTGLRHLNLRLTGQVKLPDGSQGSMDVPVKEAVISVRVNPSYLVGRFVGQNWQWIIGGPVGLLAIAAWLRSRLGKRNPEGP